MAYSVSLVSSAQCTLICRGMLNPGAVLCLQVQDVLGLPSAEASTMSAFVQSFLHDVVASVDPFGYVAEGIQQVCCR